jgi:hypothetical protein
VETLRLLVSTSFQASGDLSGELTEWQWRNVLVALRRLVLWRRRKPIARQDPLLLDAEFRIMLSELRYPSIHN